MSSGNYQWLLHHLDDVHGQVPPPRVPWRYRDCDLDMSHLQVLHERRLIMRLSRDRHGTVWMTTWNLQDLLEQVSEDCDRDLESIFLNVGETDDMVEVSVA